MPGKSECRQTQPQTAQMCKRSDECSTGLTLTELGGSYLSRALRGQEKYVLSLSPENWADILL